jgi:5'-nucleotidase
MKKRIAVDMDGVLADVVAQFILYDEKEFGRKKIWEEAIGKHEHEVFPNARSYVFTKSFFRTLPVIVDSQDILQELNKRYEVFIVSAAIEFPQSLSEKMEWLNEHFPFIQWQQIVFCGSKNIIHADIMIDDHFKNLDHFKKQTLLFSQPHNMLSDPGRHIRINSWKEIGELLLS